MSERAERPSEQGEVGQFPLPNTCPARDFSAGVVVPLQLWRRSALPFLCGELLERVAKWKIHNFG
jgi:hypothetical protein